MKNKSLCKLISVCISLLLLSSCCPDPVDRSFHEDSYNLTFDLQNIVAQKPVTSLDQESKVTLVFSNGSKSDSKSFESIPATNRFTFYFDINIKDEDIATVEIRLIDYQDQVLDFKSTTKTVYQKEPVLLAKNSWDIFLCALNPIDFLLPQAHALSCKSKEGSKLTWRSGYLISLGLTPEI